jgi:hypothetical protein
MAVKTPPDDDKRWKKKPQVRRYIADIDTRGRTSRPVSRILWCRRHGTGGHPSRAAVAGSLVRPTRRLGRAALERLHRPSSTLRCPATLLALLRVGFAEPPESPRALVVSYTAVSPLPAGSRSHDRRFAFCGTFPRVTPGGRYPPPCPVESGLSSAIQFPGPTRPPGRLVRRDCQPTGTATDLRLFLSSKLWAGRHVSLNQWTATRKRSGESQDQWTPAQRHGPDVTGWLSTVRPDEPIHRVDGPLIH